MCVCHSILILTHNRFEDVQRCFESLASTLARPDVACIVLDNGSTDGTAEWLQQQTDPDSTDIDLILSPINLGVAGGRAELLRHINMMRDRIVFLDSDTVILDPNWLDTLDAVVSNEAVGVAGPGGSFVLPDWSQFTAGAPGEVDCIAGFCQMWKTELFKQGVTVPLEYGNFWTEDSAMCLQARNLGYDVVCVPVGVQHFSSHSGFGQDMALHDAHIALFREQWQGKGLTKAEGAY